MGRPRKNRVSEYSTLLADELLHQVSQAVTRALAEQQRLYLLEVAKLRSEVRALSRQLEQALRKQRPSTRTRLGRWVPGGPGRPPKDANDRIAAFEARLESRTEPTPKRVRNKTP
ncbi:MAG: hypothetical protein IPG45_27485 [Deltaproteobacteria bacterium]|nr:hypothetical protein [Deltaproteobacteria bacterium]